MTNFKDKMMPLLIIVLVFALGFFYSKSSMLEKQIKNGNVAASDQLPQATFAPQPSPDLKSAKSISNKDHLRGSNKADVFLIVYSDYECPFCKTFHQTVGKILDEYGDKVALVLRHYPLPFHQNAQKEAEAAECVGELGGNDAFWAFTDAIFEQTTSNGTGFALEKLGPLAEELGVDQNRFQTCLDSGKYATLIQDQTADGQKAGVQGTPGTIIFAKDGSRSLIPGALPYEQVKPMIDKALQ